MVAETKPVRRHRCLATRVHHETAAIGCHGDGR